MGSYWDEITAAQVDEYAPFTGELADAFVERDLALNERVFWPRQNWQTPGSISDTNWYTMEDQDYPGTGDATSRIYIPDWADVMQLVAWHTCGSFGGGAITTYLRARLDGTIVSPNISSTISTGQTLIAVLDLDVSGKAGGFTEVKIDWRKSVGTGPTGGTWQNKVSSLDLAACRFKDSTLNDQSGIYANFADFPVEV